MMDRNLLIILTCAAVGAIMLSGCETVPKKFKEEVSGIKTRVDTLETRVEGVEGRQTELERMAQEEAARSSRRVKSNIATRSKTRSPASRAETRDIQTLLKAAGFYTGVIDGIKGRATKKAIREFQRANGLVADGVVGPKTMEALSKHKTAGEAPRQERETVK